MFYLCVILCILLQSWICCSFRLCTSQLTNKNYNECRDNLVMKAMIVTSPNQQVKTFEMPKGNYLTAIPSNRWTLGRKLTRANKKYSDMGVKLRSRYTKFRLLTEEEEKTAGKFSYLGKRLELIKSALQIKINREPTDEEWAAACNIPIENLKTYLLLSVKARNSLIQHNMRLVDYWVRKFLENTKAAKDISYYELLTEGVIGLTDAASRYDGRSRFASYAQYFIRSSIYKGLNSLRLGSYSNDWTIQMNIKAIKIKSALTAQLNRVPTPQEVAKKMNIKLSTYLSIRSAASKKVTSMDSQLEADEGHIHTYVDLFLTSTQDATHSREKDLWRNDFHNALNILTPLEKRTIAIRYGLMDGKVRNMETTAELMCLSQEGTRVVIARAMGKLRNSSAAKLLAEGVPQSPITTTSGRIGATMY